MRIVKEKAHCSHSILFYPITLEGRRGTRVELATIPLYLVLFSVYVMLQQFFKDIRSRFFYFFLKHKLSIFCNK